MKNKIGSGNRVYVQLPITLSGTDLHGSAFKEKTATVVLTREGARLKSSISLREGAVLSVETSHKVCLQAQVVHHQAVGSPNTNQIEIHCPKLANAVGIYFPTSS